MPASPAQCLPPSGSKHGGLAPWVFILFFFLSLLVRLVNIDHASFWLDEIFQAKCSVQSLGKIWSRCPQDKPPLDYYIQHCFLGGRIDETRARLHAAIFGAAAVVALGVWAQAVGGARFSLIAMSLGLSNRFLVAYSQEGRPYSLMLFAECLFFACLWRVWPGGSPRRLRDWGWLAFATGLCLWSLYFTLTALIVGFAAFLAQTAASPRGRSRMAGAFRDKWRTALIAALFGVVLLGAAPLGSRMKHAVKEDFYKRYDLPDWEDIGRYLDVFASGYNKTQRVPGARWAVVGLATAGWIGWGFRRRTALAAHFCLLFAVLNFTAVILIFKHLDHWLTSRYTLVSLPPALLLCAMGIETLGRAFGVGARWGAPEGGAGVGHWAGGAMVILCLGAVGANLWLLLEDPKEKPDWRGVSERLREQGREDAAVIVHDSFDAIVLRHYLDRDQLTCPIRESRHDPAVLEAILKESHNAWVIGEVGELEGFYKAGTSLWRVTPEFQSLDARRNLPVVELTGGRPEIPPSAHGPKNPNRTIPREDKE